MFTKIKIQLIIGLLVVVFGVFFNPYTVVKKAKIKTLETNAYNDSVSLTKLVRENAVQDSLLWSLQQDLDISKQNDTKYQILIKGLNDENKQLKTIESVCCKELKLAEKAGGIIRDTVRLNWRGKVKKKK